MLNGSQLTEHKLWGPPSPNELGGVLGNAFLVGALFFQVAVVAAVAIPNAEPWVVIFFEWCRRRSVERASGRFGD